MSLRIVFASEYNTVITEVVNEVKNLFITKGGGSMLIQKVIQVGNSLAVTIPKSFSKQAGWKAGKQVAVDEDPERETLTFTAQTPQPHVSLTPEFLAWLNKFNRRYKTVLAELAKR